MISFRINMKLFEAIIYTCHMHGTTLLELDNNISIISKSNDTIFRSKFARNF